MSDRIITRAISPYVAWQGPENVIPARLQAVGEQVEAFGGTGVREADRALSGDLVSREAVIALIEAERVRVLSKQDGKHPGVDQNLRFMALLLPGLVDALRALPAHMLPVPNPMASFEDTTHAYECGYRDGLKAAQAEAPDVDPVAWMIEGYGPTENQKFAEKYSQARRKLVTPLYATPAAPAVKVKPLVWQVTESGAIVAETSIGEYVAEFPYRSWILTASDGSMRSFVSLEAAKAAAQADYEARILAALEGGAA